MKSVRGFTIVELMVTVLILAIISMAAAPSFNNVIRSARIDSNFSKLKAGINYARSEAATRGLAVTVCASNDQATCTGNVADWDAGWIALIDEDGDGVLDDDADAILCEANEDCLLRVWDGISDDFSISVTDDRTMVRFTEGGEVFNTAEDVVTLTLAPDTCTSGQPLQRTVAVTNWAGQITTATGDCP